MPNLETPNSGTGTTPPPTTSQGDAATREKAKGAQTYDVEDSESEPEPDKEAPDGTEKNGVSYGCLPGADVLQEARRHAVHGRIGVALPDGEEQLRFLC
ncbi:hypothetical protein F2Q70_00035783 [Brassica cretica]|uniref:Uncharacterized protein n=1 Tax=Brassica cretica TaxID=69181 RepID=A0A8S9JSX5_BRACR|nr:hypothetical protein F2Q70_00035783 [Brassica cretica]